MKRMILAVAALTLGLTNVASAEEITIVGPVTKIELKAGSADVTVKDAKTDKAAVVVVKDQQSLDKLNDKRIANGTDVRVKYDSATGVARVFKKEGGC